MKKRILEDAIIFNGEVYELVECTLGDECERCDLQGYCKEYCGNYLCGMLHEHNQRIYQKAGTIEEVFARNKKRELARHHIATLIQANRYRRDRNTPAIYNMTDPVKLGEAIDFAIQELKEKYK